MTAASFGKAGVDRIQDDVFLAIDLMVAKAQDIEPELDEALISLGIATQSRRLAVLVAVHLDDKPRADTGEVDDKTVDGNLAPDMEAGRYDGLP